MTLPEDRLTAYALDDPGLTADERRAIETTLAADPAAKRAVEETRRLGELLTASLKREEVTLTADVPLTVIAPKPARRWPAYAGGLASGIALTLAVAAGVTMLNLPDSKPVAQAPTPDEREAPEGLAKADGGEPVLIPAYNEDNVVVGVKVASGRGVTDQATLNENLKAAVGRNSIKPPPVTRLPIDAVKETTATAEKKAGGKPAGDTSPAPVPNDPHPTPEAKPEPTGGEKMARAPLAAAPVVPTPPGIAGPAMGGAGIGGGYGGGLPGGMPAQPPAFAFPGSPVMGTPGSASARAAGRGGVPGRPGESEALAKRMKDAPAESRERLAEDRAKQDAGRNYYMEQQQPDQKRFDQTIENRFTKVEGQQALSTFGVDVDTASYSIARNYLMSMNQLPPANAVRLEEFVNYFPYQDKAPENDDPFAVTVEVAQCPWAPAHRLARIGLKAKPIATDKRPPSNLVFLIDVSGSMNAPNRLPLVKSSLKLLINQLGENDRVAMVVYAGTTGIVLDSTSASRKDLMMAALDRLEAGGSTNGSGGLHDAYEVAAKHFLKGGTNRVVLCTDGDWNVGTTSTEALIAMIEAKKQTGVFLSVFGFGMGNLRDEMMVKLAGKGNGNYAYIDTIKEANKALVEQMSGTIVTVAKDVKIQVEFNPAAVQSYRLLGYEKRHLNAEDFHNDAKDAGEMGAGHVVTALYELVPVGPAAAPGPGEGLKYQPVPAAPAVEVKQAVNPTEAFTVKMRHKKPDADVSTYRELPVSDTAKPYNQASEDFRFSAAAASYAMILRNSEFKGNATFEAVLDLAAGAMKYDPSGYRAEFLELVRKAKTLSAPSPK